MYVVFTNPIVYAFGYRKPQGYRCPSIIRPKLITRVKYSKHKSCGHCQHYNTAYIETHKMCPQPTMSHITGGGGGGGVGGGDLVPTLPRCVCTKVKDMIFGLQGSETSENILLKISLKLAASLNMGKTLC